MGLKPKRCFVCGRVFVPTNGKQICCSEECTGEYRNERDRLCWFDTNGELINIEIDDFLGDDIFISNQKLKSEPQLFDKVKTKKILSDFGINCDIPDFSTLQDLQNWKRKQLELNW